MTTKFDPPTKAPPPEVLSMSGTFDRLVTSNLGLVRTLRWAMILLFLAIGHNVYRSWVFQKQYVELNETVVTILKQCAANGATK